MMSNLSCKLFLIPINTFSYVQKNLLLLLRVRTIRYPRDNNKLKTVPVNRVLVEDFCCLYMPIICLSGSLQDCSGKM